MRLSGWLAALILLLAGCTQPPAEPLRIGTNIWIGYEPLYLARAQGRLNADQVKLVEYLSSTQSLRGLIDGVVDAATLTLDEALLLRESGVDISIVLVMDYSAGADALLARPGIQSLQDLRGRRIGVETTALGAYMMHRVLEMAGLGLNDIKLVSLELSQHEQAYRDGVVDALITFDPVRSRLLAQGARSIMDSRALPNEIVDLLVVRNDRIPRHKEQLQQLLGQWFVTLAQIEKEPAASARPLNSRMKLSEAELLNALQGVKFPSRSDNRQLLATTQPALMEKARHMADIMEQSQLLRARIEVTPLFDARLLQELYP